MTYDNTDQQLISYRYGEAKPVYGTITGTSGEEDISGATFTLLDATGAVVVTGGATATAPGLSTQVYYSLDTKANGILEGNWYYGYFDVPDVPSADSIPRDLRPTLAIWVAPIVEATYVLGTPIGNLRQAIADTNIPDPVFSDPELQSFLDQNGGNQNAAAYSALMAQATDRAKLAISMNSGSWGTTQTGVYQALMQLAEKFYKYRVGSILVPPTQPFFTIGNSDLGTTGTMDNW